MNVGPSKAGVSSGSTMTRRVWICGRCRRRRGRIHLTNEPSSPVCLWCFLAGAWD